MMIVHLVFNNWKFDFFFLVMLELDSTSVGITKLLRSVSSWICKCISIFPLMLLCYLLYRVFGSCTRAIKQALHWGLLLLAFLRMNEVELDLGNGLQVQGRELWRFFLFIIMMMVFLLFKSLSDMLLNLESLWSSCRTVVDYLKVLSSDL